MPVPTSMTQADVQKYLDAAKISLGTKYNAPELIQDLVNKNVQVEGLNAPKKSSGFFSTIGNAALKTAEYVASPINTVSGLVATGAANAFNKDISQIPDARNLQKNADMARTSLPLTVGLATAPLSLPASALATGLAGFTGRGLSETSDAVTGEDNQSVLGRVGDSALAGTVAGVTELAAGAALKLAGKGIKAGYKAFKGTPEEAIKAGTKTLEELLDTSDSATIRGAAEITAPKIGIREKIAGVRPDIKKRIAGKQNQLKEYFDIAHARNLDDTVPTPLEYGARSVEGARNQLQKVMNDTGNEIGQFRQKIASVKVSIDDMNNIENTFDQSLRGLNLGIKNGGIVRASGKVAGNVSDSEVKTLQRIYDDILRVKSAPSSSNLIDLRNAIQNNINFAKTARDATTVIDPLSRKVRSVIRDVNLKMIGKSQGQLLDDYSDLIGALEELNSFVDSKRGGEFLLKQVLSERGRVPREVMKKVTDYTGIDLMDDATMAQLATEIIGNSAQKGLFRQEITKAGLDAMDIIDVLSGSPGGTIRATKALMQPAKNFIAPVEETFLKAAK